MKILILGANGFIGNALVKAILDEGKHEIYGMDIDNGKLDHSLSHPKFHFVEGDINISNEWIEYHIKKCDIIIPLVAIATPNVYVKNPLKIFHLDFESNLKIVKWVAKYHKRIIFPSTSEVYGKSDDIQFNEYKSKLVLGPIHKNRWIYSCSKQLLDRVIVAYSEKGDLKSTIFRPFNWVGPKLDSLEQAQLGNGRVITIFINNLINNQDIILVNGGLQKRSFTYLGDGIDCLLKIINQDPDELNSKIFNIGNPHGNLSIKKLANIMVEIYNDLSKNRYLGKIITKTELDFYGHGYEDVPVRVPDISEAKHYLNWEPRTNIDDSIKKTINSFI